MKDVTIKKIIHSISGKNVAQRRRDALLAAGFDVSEIRTEWNFGSTGTVKPTADGFDVQIAYATGGKSRNGYGVNACPVVTVKWTAMPDEDE